MKHLSCTVATAAVTFASYKIVTFTAPDMPRIRPGQLLLARVNDSLDPYLPSAYFPLPAGVSPHDLRAAAVPPRPESPLGSAVRPASPEGPEDAVHTAGDRVPASQPATLSLLVAAADPVCHKAAGDTLELIAPIGNGYTPDPVTRRLLLVGDGAHLAPLITLAHEASQTQIAVSLLVCSAGPDGRNDTPADAALAASLSQMLPLDVEYQVAADLSAVLPALLGWADQLCAAGDATLYTLLKDQLMRQARMVPAGGRPEVVRAALLDSGSVLPAGFAQVIVAPLMACGFGACLGCAVDTARGVRLACVDGPVFDLAELA